MISARARSGYEWFALGDLNGFFGLMVDNVTVMSFLAGILIKGFHFPAAVVYQRMFPGTALGVFLGDMIYAAMAFRLARKTGNRTVTAMPLGLDTPSTIGIALTVLGPAFLDLKSRGFSPENAAILSWEIGMAVMVTIGLVKLAFSFAGSWITKIVPEAGLLGSLAGIGLALIGTIPLIDIFSLPLVGVAALGIVLYALVAKIKLPGHFPGVLAAVCVGTGLYYLLAPSGLLGTLYDPPSAALGFSLPKPSLLFLKGLSESVKYLPIAIPFAVLTVAGGINVTESARKAGDDFKTRDILLADAFSTLVSGVSGGVAQSTPYIGQPAYKKMGSRAGYSILTGLFIGLGGAFGYIGFIVELIPRAVLAPILVFVALDIMCQAFESSPARHAQAVAFAYFPAVARLLEIKLSDPSFVPAASFKALLAAPGKTLPELLVIVALGNGFIVTAMLWGAFLAKMIDKRAAAAAAYLGLLAFFSFFGVVHSALPDGSLYLPWHLALPARSVPYQFAAAYLVLAAVVLALGRGLAGSGERAEAV